MAEPVKVYKDGEEFVATSPTQVLQMLKAGWSKEYQEPEPAIKDVANDGLGVVLIDDKGKSHLWLVPQSEIDDLLLEGWVLSDDQPIAELGPDDVVDEPEPEPVAPKKRGRPKKVATVEPSDS